MAEESRKAAVRVKMLSTIAGNADTFHGKRACLAGEIVELHVETAKAWVADGMATYVREEPVETAAGRR